MEKNLRVIIIRQAISVFRILVGFSRPIYLKILKFDPGVAQKVLVQIPRVSKFGRRKCLNLTKNFTTWQIGIRHHENDSEN